MNPSDPTVHLPGPSRPPERPTTAAQQLGRYPVSGELGAGGMGTVLAVVDPQIGRTVAAKVIRGASSPDIVDAFHREARITGRLEHPNIVPVHELGTDANGRAYFTMKRIRGQELGALIRSGEASLGELLQVFVKVCDAIAYAHSEGVIHRDLKPANVMVGAFGEVLVMDWGLAKVVGQAAPRTSDAPPSAIQSGPQTLDGEIKGTPAYMPPEQAQGQIDRLDERSDIYSLGAILYEILTHEEPFTGDDIWALMADVAAGRLTSPSQRTPERAIPWELESVVLKAMARRRGNRYASVSELVRDIEQFQEGGWLAAARYSRWQRLSKALRRHRGALLATASVAFVALVVTAIFVWRARAAERRRQAGHRTRVAAARAEVERRSAGLPTLEALRQALSATGSDDRDAAVDPAQEAERWKAPLAGWLATVSALDRALFLSPGDRPLVARRRQAGEALGLTALLGGDNNLARQVLADLRGWGASADDVDALLAQVRRVSNRVHARQAQRVDAILADVGAGLERPGRTATWTLEEYVSEIASHRHGPTLARLATALDTLTARASAARGAARWSNADRDLAVFLCRGLGRLGRAEAVPPLARWCAVVRRPELIVEVARALCNTRQATARDAIDALRRRIGAGAEVWHQLRRALRRLPLPELPGDSTRDARRAHAELLHERGDDETALAILDRLLAEHPDDYEALGIRGVLRAARGDLRRARADYDRAIAGAPQIAGLWFNSALLRKAQGQHREALRELERHVRLAPRSAIGWSELGLARYRAGDRKGALRDTGRGVQLDPSNGAALAARGVARHGNGDASGARADYDRALQLAPELVEAHLNRAHLWAQLGQVSEALAGYDATIRLDPRRVVAYRARARLRADRGDIEGALEDYNRVIVLRPTATSLCLRAQLWRREGQLDRADHDYALAAERAPRSAAVHIDWGALSMQRGRLKHALTRFEKALTLERVPTRAWMYYGVALALAGRSADALKSFAEATRRDPRYPYPALWRACLSGEAAGLASVGRRDDWPATVARWLAGALTDEALQAAAAAAPTPAQQAAWTCEAQCYLGMRAERAGQLGAARDRYRRAVGTRLPRMLEHLWARMRLEQLKGR